MTQKAAVVDDLGSAAVDELAATLTAAGLVSAGAGRIFALLMISEEPLSQADIREQLQLSEGSVSEGTRALETMGMIERVEYPKVRRDFFRIHSEAWINCAEETLRFVADMHAVADRLQQSVRRPSPTVREQLTRMSDYYALLARELPPLLRHPRNQVPPDASL